MQAEIDLNRACARVFSGPQGELVLGWLRASYIHLIMGPDATDAALRYREGQRSVVAALETRIEQGKTEHGIHTPERPDPASRRSTGR